MSGGPGMGIPSPYGNMLGRGQSGLSQSGLQGQQLGTQQQALLLQQQLSGLNAASTRPSSPLLKPDPKQPDTLGWREWRWSDSSKTLLSPSQGTPWPEAELVVPDWNEGDAVRGVSGIHAHLMPKHWKILGDKHAEYVQLGPERVHGVVERFGKYVLGTEGWRAEWVVIKELMAPSTEVGLALEQAYPDVIVHYPDEEGDESCTSEKSLKLGKGNRPTPRAKPIPLSIPFVAPSQASSLQAQALAAMVTKNNALLRHLQQKALLQSVIPTPNPPSESPSSHGDLVLWEAASYLAIVLSGVVAWWCLS